MTDLKRDKDAMRAQFKRVRSAIPAEERARVDCEIARRVKELSARTEEYLTHVRAAGREFAAGDISRETRQALSQLPAAGAKFPADGDDSHGISSLCINFRKSL